MTSTNNTQNVENYLKELGLFETVINSDNNEFKEIIDDVLFTNIEKEQACKIRRKEINKKHLKI